MTAPTFRGTVRRQPDGTIGGELREVSSTWPIRLVLTPERDEAGPFYRVEGFLGPTPEALRLPGEDEMRRPT